MILEPRSPSESEVETRYLVMPDQANPIGTVFGGAIVSMIDMVAAMTARRHSRRSVVTVSMDSIIFREPIYVGDHVILKASVNHVGKTSMEVGVKVWRDEPKTGETMHATTAYLTFVAIGDDKKPTAVPSLKLETPEQKRRFKHAEERVAARQALRLKLAEG